ncbi:MAG: MATE family efflux transporter [Lachnospiraceae bacterium]|nr:MATE family efflux transporter [Lachnospiraceae bacterium]
MKQVDFSDGHIVRNIFKTALPMLAAQILNLLYNIVDRIYIGRIPEVGTAALGAVGLCFPIIILIAAFTVLYGSGGSPIFAISLGKGNRDRAALIMNTAFRLLVATAIVLTAAGYLFARPLLTLFGASEDALIYSLPYLRIYLIGTLFSMLATGMNPFINAQGFPGIGMLTVVLGAVSNLILDPILIFGLGLGVEGAATATVLSQCLSAVFVLKFLTGKQAEISLKPLSKEDREEFIPVTFSIIGLGIASFVMQVTNSLVNISCNQVLSDLGGDLYVSIMTIVSSVRQIVEVPVLAIAEGSSPIISFCYGAGRKKEVKKAIFVMAALGFTYAALAWLLIIIFPEFFIQIFSSDREILQDAIPALHIYFFAFIFMTLQYSGQTVFKSLNKRNQAIFFSLFRKVIIVVPLTYLLPYAFGLGTNGVFMAEPISNVIGGGACFITMLLTVMPELKTAEKTS